MSKSNKLKTLIGKLLGIKQWKLKSDGHLDVTDEELTGMKETYGEDFVRKLEQLLGEENAETHENSGEDVTKHEKSDMLKLELLCALLAIEAITLSEDGTATLSKEQLEGIEAGLKKLQDEKTAAESLLDAAQTERDNAVTELSGAITAMDDLDPSVKTAANATAKVEAIRKKLAEKPASAATAIVTKGDQGRKKIEGADPVNEYANEIL